MHFGEEINASTLKLPRAIAVIDLLRNGESSYVELTQVLRDASGVETVVLDLEVELPQIPLYPVKDLERVAVRFFPGDQRAPDVRALREDFPRVPHQNLVSEDYPKSLCLYDRPWSELRLRWTAIAFIERIREWIALTARGELHGADQPLEPILNQWEHIIVLPARGFLDAGPERPIRMHAELQPSEGTSGVLVAYSLGSPIPRPGAERLVAALFQCEPQQHGVIQRAPRSLEDLHVLASAAGLDLKRQLQLLLRSWSTETDIKEIREARLIILLRLPKTRNPDAAPESNDVWAFLLHSTIKDLGVMLDAWAADGRHMGVIIGGPGEIAACPTAMLSVLNPVWTLTNESAARSNGTDSDTCRFLAIGAGALGSQLLLNLARCGFGTWTYIDGDTLLPHNLARHALDGFAVGMPKAEALAQFVHSIQDSDQMPTAIIADILSPGKKAEVIAGAMAAAHCVLDLSASVPVARMIARSAPESVRRVSVFLNPSGTDLVLLAEDAERRARLDHLEHQFYRELLTHPDLANHFELTGRIRYAHSCRDVSSTLPQHLVAMHAAIGSKGFRDAVSLPQASIRVWHADNELSVKCIQVPVKPVHEMKVGSWTVCMDDAFLSKVRTLRLGQLPNETGGVLIGSFDLERSIIYLVDTVPSPQDSVEWPTLYIRGSSGLSLEVKRIGERTAGMLQYIGEWHSHPTGVPPLPSADDCKVFAWLTELMGRDGFPAVMLIASDDREAIYVGKMIQGSEA